MVTIKKTLLILIVVSGTLLLHTTLLKTDEKPVVTSIDSQTKKRCRSNRSERYNP
ncbi:hypothetical protein I569_00105 [Enterococcus dispar ATCC 51266]|uniref:Uncharacterized protein n=1 Tax=Enterococcus dispar ATCC 51266 TaxID=1139219 RepID=S1NXE2_9ENTE|nr:hypothetical protein OMK_01094 [Enterococcus dispar ATCC 51266]EOW84816.1 hypothetical protein I569_00105 [Enterococcus dispar ATCC 51266]